MFLTGFLSGAGLNGPDPQQERDPPPDPTPITFPKYEPYSARPWTTEERPPDLRSLFARILKPSDITDDHVTALNIRVLAECSVDELVPLAEDGSSYLPSLVADQPINSRSPVDAAEEDSLIASKRKGLEDRLAELRVENDLAFRTLTRTVTQGVRPPRLAYMRKFWEGLENMSHYWDCSLDHYYEWPESTDEEEKCVKRQRFDTTSSAKNGLGSISPVSNERSWPLSEGRQGGQVRYDENQAATAGAESDPSNQTKHRENGPAEATTARSERQPRMRYQGRRSSTGRAMPDQFRADTVKAFVEGTIWPFRTTLSPPRMMPILQFGKLILPVRQTAAVYRMPNDRKRARAGWLEGPILSVQVRPETDFRSEDDQQLEEKARLDFVREVGALLQLAQERRREGKAEVMPGEGMWWTTKPRWGGGPGGEVQNEIGNTDVLALAGESVGAGKEKDSNKSRERRSPAILWKEVKGSRGYWEPKTQYEAIGANPDSGYDDVFLISSLNHHVAILKMTVHAAYVDCLTSGTAPHMLPYDPNWSRPSMTRTQWFDLFDMDERLEAFRGLWGVMAYLTRETKTH